MKPEKAKREDFEYLRNGTCSIFIFSEPLGFWRYAQALPVWTKIDRTLRIRWLLNEQYSEIEKVVLIMDNLNTYTLSSLYEAFPPKEVFRFTQRLAIHYTPKHGSRLYIAEVEFAAMAAQCLGQRRIPDLATMNMELAVWHIQRNRKQKGVD